jgi:hypothetical protein
MHDESTEAMDREACMVTVAKTLRRSLVDRESRSRRVGNRTSPACRVATALDRASRSHH